MPQDNRSGPPSRGGKPGGDRRDGPGGKGRGPGGKGGFGKGGPAKTVRAETYETLKELTRGAGFRIDKFTLAEKGTHKIVKTEYRLFREGLEGRQNFERLVDAQAAAIAPLPEPEPEPEPEVVETLAEALEGEAEADQIPSEGGGGPVEAGETAT